MIFLDMKSHCKVGSNQEPALFSNLESLKLVNFCNFLFNSLYKEVAFIITMETQIQVKMNTIEKALIEKAGDLIGLPHSTFLRTVGIEKARSIINQNLEVIQS